jgi:hypothetical protein
MKKIYTKLRFFMLKTTFLIQSSHGRRGRHKLPQTMAGGWQKAETRERNVHLWSGQVIQSQRNRRKGSKSAGDSCPCLIILWR